MTSGKRPEFARPVGQTEPDPLDRVQMQVQAVRLCDFFARAGWERGVVPGTMVPALHKRLKTSHW